MSAPERNVGRLNIPVGIDLETLRREARGKLRAEASRIGEQTADDVLKGAKQRFQQRTADAAESLARGLIDKKALQRETAAAMDQFDKEVLRGIDRLGKAGKLTQDEFTKLGNSLKNAGKTGADGFRGEADGLGKWLRGTFVVGLVASFTYAATRIAGVMGGIARNIRATLELGGSVDERRTDFGELAVSRGVSPSRTMDELRRGTRGLVTDMELLTRANFALQSGLPATEEGFGRLAEGARRLARAAGRDATEAFGRLVTGIVKAEQNILEELGLVTRMEDALKAWERQTGRNSDALDQQQKVAVFYNAVMLEMEGILKRLGPEETSARERIGQLATAWTNLKDQSAEAVANAPAVAAFLESIGAGAEGSSAKVQRLADTVGAFVQTLAETNFNLTESDNGLLKSVGWLAKIVTMNERSRAGALNQMTGMGGGPTFGERLDANVEATRERRMAEEELLEARAALVRLLDEEAAGLTTVAAVQSALSRSMEEEARLRETNLMTESHMIRFTHERVALGNRLKELRAAEAPDPAKLAAQKEADEKLIEQWQLLQMSSIERQVRELERYETAAKRLGESGAAAEMARQREELEKQLALHARLASGDIPQFLLDLAARARDPLHTRQAAAPMRNEIPVGEQIAALQEELQTRLALLRVQRETGEITEKQFETGVQDVTRAANRQLLELLKTFEHMGIVAPAVLRKIAGALLDVEDDTVSTSERVAELAEEFVAVARGVLAAADAMGLLDDQQRKVIDGAINAASGIGRFAAGDVLGGTVQTIGGLIQLGAGLFGESQADKDRKETVKQNSRALEELALELRGFSVTMAVVAKTIEAINRYGAGGSLGMSDAEIDAVAREYGIEIRDRKGRIQREQLEQLRQALRMDMEAGGVIASGVSQQERISTSGTVVQFSRMIDLQASSVDHLSAIRRAIVDGAYLPAGGGAAAAHTIINVAVSAGEAVTAASAENIGKRIGAGVHRALSERVTDAYAASGVKGPVRLELRV